MTADWLTVRFQKAKDAAVAAQRARNAAYDRLQASGEGGEHERARLAFVEADNRLDAATTALVEVVRLAAAAPCAVCGCRRRAETGECPDCGVWRCSACGGLQLGPAPCLQCGGAGGGG